MTPRKTATVTFTYITARPKADTYQFPEDFYMPENMALYQRARKLCKKYNLPYAEARQKFLEEQEMRYPDPASYEGPSNPDGYVPMEDCRRAVS